MKLLQGSRQTHIDNLVAYQIQGSYHQNGLASSSQQRSLSHHLRPISAASHTRDRTRSPPDSACFPGTRLDVIRKLNAWASRKISSAGEPHICWIHGFLGCGKSAISQDLCGKYETKGKPVASLFFFQGERDRNTIWGLARTLASQMALAIPETAPFIHDAVDSNPGLLDFQTSSTSVAMQMQRLVYGPFKAASQINPKEALARYPFLIVLDGLDECSDKDEVQALLDGMLSFFKENPFIPLRVFITSRVEQHIKSRLNSPRVRVEILHCSNDDITTFLDILFDNARKQSPVVQAYVEQHGEWPSPPDKRQLVEHIAGSFISASAIFRFIMGMNAQGDWHPSTPMDRLSLSLRTNPSFDGLDGIYAQILSRSEHIPHFSDIISTIALLWTPLPTSAIAHLLGIHTYEVVNVLVDLQAIIQVPGTDDTPVTLCHTSLRDFLTTQSRSGRFFARPSHHARLFLGCIERELELRRQRPGGIIHGECPSAVAYALRYSMDHLAVGDGLFRVGELNSAIRLRREALHLHGSYPTPELLHALADVMLSRFRHTWSMADLEEAIFLYRETLSRLPASCPDCSIQLNSLGNSLLDRYRRTGSIDDPQEAISLYRDALKLRPSPHRNRSSSLSNLGYALLDRYRRMGSTFDLDEVVRLIREVITLRPPPHSGRSSSLNLLAEALLDCYHHTQSIVDLEEAIFFLRESLKLQPLPHPNRLAPSLDILGNALMAHYRRTGLIADLEGATYHFRESLHLFPAHHPACPEVRFKLVTSLHSLYEQTRNLSHLEEATFHCEELVPHYPFGHKSRVDCLSYLVSLVEMHFDATGRKEDLDYIARVKEEAIW